MRNRAYKPTLRDRIKELEDRVDKIYQDELKRVSELEAQLRLHAPKPKIITYINKHGAPCEVFGKLHDGYIMLVDEGKTRVPYKQILDLKDAPSQV